MPRLFSYCIPFDDGAAPNPYWVLCTLNICKPVIRRNAQVGDWVVGTGSTEFGFQNKVVYAMEVTEKMTMQSYYEYCKSDLPNKISKWDSNEFSERIGDCIYDFSVEPARLLKSVHGEGNRLRDFGGQYALLSDHYYYFGNQPEHLPDHLLPIVRQGQGHKSTYNQPYVHDFIDWIMSQTKAKNKVYSQPMDKHRFDHGCAYESACAARNQALDDADEDCCEEDAKVVNSKSFC